MIFLFWQILINDSKNIYYKNNYILLYKMAMEQSKKNIEKEKEIIRDSTKSMTIPNLIVALQNYPVYQNLSKHYIDKELSKKYGVTTIKKSNYIDELNQLQEKSKVIPTQHLEHRLVTNNFVGVADVDLQILHNLDIKDLYHVCQSNKYLHDLCQERALKERIRNATNYIKFPMIGQVYHFVNKPDIAIKKVIKFNKDKYDTLHRLNQVYCNIDGIMIYLTSYEKQYFTEKIVIDTPISLTLMDIIQYIVDEFTKPELNGKFMKKYKKGAILMGMEYHHDGYYLILDRYL
jgi:hypothetical protein